MTTLIQAYTQPFYHATCPQFALCLSHPTALKPSPPNADAYPRLPSCPITFSYSGDRATTQSKMPGLDVSHQRELFYITSSIIQITKGSAVTLRLAENYLNRITPLITQLRAHRTTEEAGHKDCCWTLASLASPASHSKDSEDSMCPLPSCETSHPALFRRDGNHLILVGGSSSESSNSSEQQHPHPSTVTLPLRLDGNGHLSRDTFTQPCHTLAADPAALRILLDRPVMALTAALLLAAKSVNESGTWLRRIAHTTVQDPAELMACERALLRALQWHTSYRPVPGLDSRAVRATLDVVRAPVADLKPVLGEAPTYYQCIPWMLWQFTAHDDSDGDNTLNDDGDTLDDNDNNNNAHMHTHEAIASAFMRPCSFVPKEVQQEILEHLAWLSRTVAGSVLPAADEWAHAAERTRLDLLVGVVARRPLGAAVPSATATATATTVGRLRVRRVSSAARKRETRMLKHAIEVVVKKPKRSRSVDTGVAL